MDLSFSGTAVEWRGPAPYVFVPLPVDVCEDVREQAALASYGWGVVPVEAELRGVGFTTSLFPKDGGYLLPLKVAVQRRAGVTVGDHVTVSLSVVTPARRR